MLKNIIINLLKEYNEKLFDCFYNQSKNNWKDGLKLPKANLMDFDFENMANSILKANKVSQEVKGYEYLNVYIDFIMSTMNFDEVKEYVPYIRVKLKTISIKYIKFYKGTTGVNKNKSIKNNLEVLFKAVGYGDLWNNNIISHMIPSTLSNSFENELDYYYKNSIFMIKNNTINYNNYDFLDTCKNNNCFFTRTNRLFLVCSNMSNLHNYLTQALLIFSFNEEEFRNAISTDKFLFGN